MLLRMELLKKGWNENAVNEFIYRLTEKKDEKDDSWWTKMTPQQQKDYIKQHPKSQKAIQAKEKEKEDDESGGKEQDSFEVDEKSEIGTIDNFETELKNSNAKLEKLQVALDKAKETGDEKKLPLPKRR